MLEEILVAVGSGAATGLIMLIGQFFISKYMEKVRKREFKQRVQDALSATQQGKVREVLLKTDVEKSQFNTMMTEVKKQDAIDRLKMKREPK